VRRFVAIALVAALLPLSGARALLPQDDAGSGGDAPNEAEARVRIEPGHAYSGTLEGTLLDAADYYAFTARAGAAISASASGILGCFYLQDDAGTQLAFGCPTAYALTAEVSAVAPYTGTYFLRYSYVQPDSYEFSLGIDAPAPPLANTVEAQPFASGGFVPPVRPATQRDKHVVVAVVDTGINPYHEFFRAPGLTAHPSTWLPGFPRSAETVRLTLDAPDVATAKAADEDTWASLELSKYGEEGEFDDHLYTFPGTRVVGAVSFGEYVDNTDVSLEPAPLRPVRDDTGHGTHSAGLALGANLPEADGNVLVVMVEVGKGTFDEGIRWAARQPWIDAVSVSLGVVANAPVGAPNGVGNSRNNVAWFTREGAALGKPTFVAAGNGVTSTGVAPDKCTTYTSEYVGPIWVTRVGAASSGDGSPTYWHCVPVEATARTNVASPSYDGMRGGTSATGTSAATPNAAGHWAHLMLAARRGGSRATRLKALEYLLHAAAPPPAKPGASDPSAYPLSLADQGYGLIDARAVDLARTALLAASGPAARPETTEWFAEDRAIRIQLWGAPPEPART
jgi:hypothetical protein